MDRCQSLKKAWVWLIDVLFLFKTRLFSASHECLLGLPALNVANLALIEHNLA